MNEHWTNVARPPKERLREITGGRLKGMTDINPQWRLEAMTEEYGLCGIGWAYEITKQWIEEGSGGQKCAFTDIDLYIKDGDEWSRAIPGTGGSMFVVTERNGQHTSDEAFKAALTDALSVAMKALGMASDIYMGKWDGSKYKEDQTTDVAEYQEPSESDIISIKKTELSNKMRGMNNENKIELYKFAIQEETLDNIQQFIDNFDRVKESWKVFRD